jgi:hypothetical protein
MSAFKSNWFRAANRLLGTSRKSKSRPTTARRTRALGRGFEPLENRTVLSVSFGAAASIGNDVGASAALDVAADSTGNSYVTGYFSGTVDFDQAATHAGDADILTARGSTDGFVAKYAQDDSLVWVRRMGGDAQTGAGMADGGRKIEVDAGGNVYVAGDFIGSADFGSTTLFTAGDRDAFVARLDASGTIQWAKDWGTTANESGAGAGVDSAGNVYALAFSWGTAFDILKFNPSGSLGWSKSIAANPQFPSGDLAADAAGNVLVAGSFSGTVDFDPGPKTKSVSSGPSCCGVNEAAFALKLNSDGKFGWVSPFVGQVVGSTKGYAWATSVTLDSGGNVLVGGSYDNAVDFNPGSGTTTLPTIGGGFVSKLSSSGGLAWARALETTSPIYVYGLDVDTAGSVYASGSFHGTVDLNPSAGTHTRTTAGSSDVFVMRLTSAGNFTWGETFGGTGHDVGWGIAAEADGDVHVAGAYQGTVDFDPDPLATYTLSTPGSFRNGFRLRLRQL